MRRVSAFGALAKRPIGVHGSRWYTISPVAGQSRVACGVLAGRQGQGTLGFGLPVSMQVRRFAHFDAIQEDKRETREELERLEIKEKDRQRSAESEDGEQGSQSKLANAMSKGEGASSRCNYFGALISSVCREIVDDAVETLQGSYSVTYC